MHFKHLSEIIKHLLYSSDLDHIVSNNDLVPGWRQQGILGINVDLSSLRSCGFNITTIPPAMLATHLRLESYLPRGNELRCTTTIAYETIGFAFGKIGLIQSHHLY